MSTAPGGGGATPTNRHGAAHHSSAALPTAPRTNHQRATRRGAVTKRRDFASAIGLVGTFIAATSSDWPPAFASVIISLRIGSSWRRDGRPQTATTSSIVGQRSSGSFSNICITAAARLGGQSGRSRVMSTGRSLKWAYITVMLELLWNGRCPVSISYATTPREYWSEAPETSQVAHCSGLMYAGVPTVTPVMVSPSASCTFAMPKSVTTAEPSSSIMMLADLMSR